MKDSPINPGGPPAGGYKVTSREGQVRKYDGAQGAAWDGEGRLLIRGQNEVVAAVYAPDVWHSVETY